MRDEKSDTSRLAAITPNRTILARENMSNLLDLQSTEQSRRFEQQNQDEHREGNGVAVGGPGGAGDERFDNSNDHSAERGAGDVADTPEDRRDESFQAGQGAHERIDGGIVQRVEDAPGAGQRRAQTEGKRNDAVNVDPHQRGGHRV